MARTMSFCRAASVVACVAAVADLLPTSDTRRKHVKRAKALTFRQSEAGRCVSHHASFTTGTKTSSSTKTSSTESV
jgi:hypothetical protein